MTAPTEGFAPITSRPSQETAHEAQPAADPRALLPESTPFVNRYTRALPDPAVTFSGPGYFTPKAPSCGFAAASIACAFAGVILVLPSVLAIIFGHIGLVRTANHARTGRGLALGGTILGYAVALFWSIFITTSWITS